MSKLFNTLSYEVSKKVTRKYSTSFSLAIRLFKKDFRQYIYALYGFVRFADEIVDTFYDHNPKVLFEEFKSDYHKSLERKISLNPILNSFHEVVTKFSLHEYVDSFLKSMEMDLEKKKYTTQEQIDEYIYGSANVIGLMILKICAHNDDEKFKKLTPYALKLGSAFQKVNFLRDLNYDTQELGRYYFPHINNSNIYTNAIKKQIVEEVKEEFKVAKQGIKQLPKSAKLGVYLAYKYYLILLKKIESRDIEIILNKRTRVSNFYKFIVLNKAYLRHKFNIY